MTNKQFSNTISLIVIFLIILLPTLVYADPGGGLDGDPGAPIDGGASLLVGAAVVYGARKLKKRKQTEK